MKKIIVFIAVLFTSLFLYACNNHKISIDALLSNLTIQFESDDSLSSVTQNFTLPLLPTPLEDVAVLWESSNSDLLTVEDGIAIVSRPIGNNSTVTLKISFTYNDLDYEKNYILTILGVAPKVCQVSFQNGDQVLDQILYTVGDTLNLPTPTLDGYTFEGWYFDNLFINKYNPTDPIVDDVILYAHFVLDNLEDTIAPTIYGTKDLIYFVGDSLPDLLEGIYATDDISTNLVVTFDDSEIEYTIPGTYNLTYSTTDEASNVTTKVVSFTVFSNAVYNSFTETFDTIGTASTSYTSSSFTGVNSLVWSYINSRNDELSIDGRSVTFGKDSTAQIEVSFDGGISGFSFQTINAYTGDDLREISVYINDTFISSFNSISTVSLFEMTGLSYSGEVTFRIENTHGQRVTIDNITIYQGSDEVSTKLTNVKDALSITTHFMENGTIILPSILNEVAIEWSFTNSNNTNNTFINLVTGAITVPSTSYVEVSLTATLSYQNVTINKTFVIKLGEILVSIIEAKSTTGLVKTSGYITGIIDLGSTLELFIQDETGAMIATVNKAYLLNLGDVITLKGTVNNQILSSVTSLEVTSTHLITVNPLTANMSTFENKPVRLIGLVKEDYVSGDLVLSNSLGSFQVVDKTNESLFLDLLLGQVITLTAHVVKVSNSYQLWVSDGTSFSVSPVDYTQVIDLILSTLNIDFSTVNSDIYLPVSDSNFGSVIAWQSSNTTYLSNTGIYSAPDTDLNINLTYSISIKGVIRYTDTLNVVLQAPTALTGYYQNASGLSGNALLAALTTIISANYHSISYTATNAVLEIADKYPGGSGYLGIYDHIQITAYNKEHVWPQSSFNEALPYKSDMHHLRISDSTTNSIRSNYFFNTATIITSTWWKTTNRFYPGDLDRGDIARMLLYMAVRYRNDGFRLIVADSGNTSSAAAKTMGNLAVLLSWHLADPVDDFERNRNEVIYGTQNNRNPFIDHPELFESIWQLLMNEQGYNNSPRINKYMSNLNVELEDTYQKIETLTYISTYKNEFMVEV